MKKYRGVLIGITVVTIVTIIFGAALMGSIVGAKPNAVPIAFVMEDEGAVLPNGMEINIGEMISEKLLFNDLLPFEWVQIDSLQELQQKLDDREIYGAIILPQALSQHVFSLMSEQQQVAEIKAVYNEGANMQAASLLKQAMPSIMPVINGAIRDQLTELVGAQTGGMIPASMVVMLSSPIQLNEEVVHPIPNRNAMGNAPGLFAQLLWVSNLALALVLFFGLRKINLLSSYGIKNRLQQLSFGIVLPPLFAALIVWMAESWYGMELASSLHTWIWLMLIGYSFFFLQSALFNLIGFPATALIVLLMFFSLPIVNMAPQFLSEVTNTFIYSWSPLRLAASSVRSLLYFDGFNIQRDSNIIVLITMASISLIVLLLTSLLDKIKSNSKTKLTSM